MDSTKASRFATVNGIRIHYVEDGAGPVVILLHGFPETHRSWDLQIPALVQAGFRVVAPDLRGYGKSDRPATGYDLDHLGADVAGFIDAVSDGPVFVVGHDWVGAVAWHVASRHPQRLRKVIILNCPHPVIMARALVSDRKQITRSWYMFFFQLPRVPEWWLTRKQGANVVRLFRASFVRPHEPPADIVEASRQALLEPGAARAAIAYYRASLRMAMHPLKTRATMRSYEPIRVPVKVVWGERDTALGIELLDGTDRYAPDLDVVRVPNAGHFVHQEQPDVFNAHLIEALQG